MYSVWCLGKHRDTEKDEDAELIFDHSSFHLLTFHV